MIESLLSNNTTNRFKFLMTSTRWKNCGLRLRDGAMPHTCRKPRTVDSMLLWPVPHEF